MGKSDHKRKKYDKDEKRSRSPSRNKEKRGKHHRSSSNDTGSSSNDSDDLRSRKRSHSRDREKRRNRHARKSSSSGSRSRSPVGRKEVFAKPMTKEEKRKHKEMLKAIETMEEKRLRRMKKKESKDRKRKENMGWDEEMMDYTNEDNPFGDPNLLDTFVWQKKNEKLGLAELDPEKLKKMSKSQQVENRIELQKVKQRRQEREKEREEREREMEDLQRMREVEYYKEWERQEDHFHLEQAKMRSKIRIQDGRAKPIDLLGQYISTEDGTDDMSIQMQEPYHILKGLTIFDLEDLLEDIKVYVEFEQNKNLEFWKDITIITEDELAKLKKIDPESQEARERREGINASVSKDVAGVFQAKTHSQLLALKTQINERIRSGNAVDIGYWESLLQQLSSHMARARLKERHQEKLRNKLATLRQQQGVEVSSLFPSGAAKSQTIQLEEAVRKGEEERRAMEGGAMEGGAMEGGAMEGNDGEKKPETVGEGTSEEAEPIGSTSEEVKPSGSGEAKGDEEEEELITEEDLMAESHDEYIQGSYSPRLLQPKDLPFDTMIYDPEEDMMKLERARKQLIATGSAEATAESEFIKKAKEGMGLDEGTFAVEFDVENKPYLWADKYRPRKPRYFNRVHTGFEWNKYNQTHYDMDNPPPKIVQGYKFNIFYPDLIDKRKTPEYTIQPSSDNKDFAVLTFSTGPPYEDIAFKIVNREWELSHRYGFRCQFSNSIFQLWFRFKRYRYRR